MNQNCENFKNRIAESLSGSIEKERQHLLDHIRGCQECKAFEAAINAEDELLSRLFAGLEEGLQQQQDDVIKAVSYIQMSRRDRFLAKINSFIDHPAFKLTAAAAVIIFVAFYSIKTMSWLNDLKFFMDACSYVR